MGFTEVRIEDLKTAASKKNDVSIINIWGDVTAITGEAIEDAYQ